MKRPALAGLIVLGLTASLACALPGAIAGGAGGDERTGDRLRTGRAKPSPKERRQTPQPQAMNLRRRVPGVMASS